MKKILLFIFLLLISLAGYTQEERTVAYKGAAFGDPARRGSNWSEYAFKADTNYIVFDYMSDFRIEWKDDMIVDKVQIMTEDYAVVYEKTKIKHNYIDYEDIKKIYLNPMQTYIVALDDTHSIRFHFINLGMNNLNK